MKTTIDLNEVRSIHNKLNDEEKVARLQILNAIIEHGVTPLTYFDESIRKLIPSLIQKDAVVVEEEAIAFAYPVSGKPTQHRVTLADGRSFCAMCGIDALGSTFTFHEDVMINSVCSSTGEPVRVDIRDGKIVSHSPEELYVIHVNLNANTNWAASC